MRKKAALAVLLIICALVISGCMKTVEDYDAQGQSMEVVEKYLRGRIIVDRETNVMYWMSEGAENMGTLTLLVDEHGQPKLYKGK